MLPASVELADTRVSRCWLVIVTWASCPPVTRGIGGAGTAGLLSMIVAATLGCQRAAKVRVRYSRATASESSLPVQAAPLAARKSLTISWGGHCAPGPTGLTCTPSSAGPFEPDSRSIFGTAPPVGKLTQPASATVVSAPA